MKRKTTKLISALAISLLLLAVMAAGLGGLGLVKARTVIIDAVDDWDDAGWEMDPPNQTNLGHIGRNTRWEGEYIWNDNVNDHRTNWSGNEQADLIAFRITADANNLYFYARMQNIITSTGNGAPMIQVAIDTDRQINSGEVWFAANADTKVYSGTAASAQWEYLLATRFGSGNNNVIVWQNGLSGTQIFVGSAAISATTDQIEFSVPWTALDMTRPPTLPLRFSVATFRANAGDDAWDSSGNSDAVDALTNYGDPGDTSNTWSEVSDGVVDYYFDLFFEADGDIYPPLLISEVLYDPSGTEPDDEFIELYNVSPITLELSVAATGRAFKVGDEETIDSSSGAESMAEFAFGSSIGAGEVVVIARDGSRFNTNYGFLPDFEFEWASSATNMYNYAEWDSDSILQIQLGNSGDQVILLDPSDTAIDVVVYEHGIRWPGVGDYVFTIPEGSSLERAPATIDTNHINNDFTARSGNGDPGSVRDVSLSVSKSVTPTAALPGEILTYTVILSNAGDAPAAPLVFTDALPAEVSFARWVERPTGALTNSGVITWGGTLTQNTALTFTFVVTNNAAGQIVTNTARYLYLDSRSGSAGVTYTARSVYSVTFVYHDEEDVIQSGDSAILSGDWDGADTTMSADANNTVFTATIGGLPAGSYAYKYKVLVSGVGGINSIWLNYPSDRAITVTANATVHDYREYLPVSGVSAKLNGPASISVNVGEASGYITSQVTIDSLTPGVTQGRGVAAQLGYGADADYPNWNWQTMAYSATGSAIVSEDIYRGVITPAATGIYSYAVRFDPNWGPNNPNAVWTYGDLDGNAFSLEQSGVLSVTAPNLSISKTAQPSSNVNYRGQVTYTIILSNTGDGDAAGVLLSDTLPVSVTFARWIEQPAGANESGGVISWTGTLTAAKSLTFTFVVSHTGDYGDAVTNTAQFTHSSGGGSAEAAFSVTGAPGISIVSPANGAVFIAADSVSVTIPITVSLSNFAIPSDGHWHLWVDGVMRAMVYNTNTTVNLMTGTRVISAQLVDAGHQPIGPVDTVTVTVNAPQVVTYSVRVTAVGSGTVALNHPDGVYNDGETAVLTATADTGWHFSAWSGDLSGVSSTVTLIITGDKRITATFEQDITPPVTYTLSVNIVGQGQVDLNPPGSQSGGSVNFGSVYTAGTSVTPSAMPAGGWSFDGWSGTSVFPIVMDADKTITATFTQDVTPPVTYTLSVTIVGSGTVALNHPDGVYNNGETATLTATEESGWVFDGWSGGGLSGTTNPITLTMTADITVTAAFAINDFRIYLPVVMKN